MSIIVPKFFFPLVVTTANRGIVANIGAGDVTANIATGTYLSAESLRAAVETALQTIEANFKAYLTIYNRQTGTYYATDRSGKFAIVNGSTTFSLKCGSASFTAYEILGFFALTYNSSTLLTVYAQRNADGGANLPSTNTVVAPNQHQNGWYPERPAVEDSLPVRDREMNVTTRAVAGQTKTLLETELGERRWLFQFLEGWKVYRDFESTTRMYESVERLWDTGYEKFRFFPNELSESSSVDYLLTLEALRRFEPRRQFTRRGLYEYELRAWKYVA